MLELAKKHGICHTDICRVENLRLINGRKDVFPIDWDEAESDRVLPYRGFAGMGTCSVDYPAFFQCGGLFTLVQLLSAVLKNACSDDQFTLECSKQKEWNIFGEFLRDDFASKLEELVKSESAKYHLPTYWNDIIMFLKAFDCESFHSWWPELYSNILQWDSASHINS